MVGILHQLEKRNPSLPAARNIRKTRKRLTRAVRRRSSLRAAPPLAPTAPARHQPPLRSRHRGGLRVGKRFHCRSFALLKPRRARNERRRDFNDAALCIEHSVTADMDGQPLSPLIEDGVVWHVVRRIDGRTTWRRLSLSPSASLVTVWRTAPGDQTRAP